MAVYIITAVVLVIYIVLTWFVGTWLHLHGVQLWVLRALLWLIGLTGAGAFIWFYRKNRGAVPADAGGVLGPEIDQRVHEALDRLRAMTRSRSSNFGDQTLVLLLGPTGATKTSVVTKSGIDADLLSGHVEQDGAVVSTRSANLFYTRHAVFVDAGGSLLDQPGGVRRLLARLQPNNFARAMRSGQLPGRVAMVCIHCDFFSQGAQATSAMARKLNASLQEIAQVLGSDYAVYVLFTKADRIPGFTEYVTPLTAEEATQVLGATLKMRRGGSGVYAEEETKRLTAAFDELFCSLAEKRTEFLAREMNPEKLGSIYEFPRELRKLRATFVQFLVDVCRPTQMPANPFLRGFYFCGVRPMIVEDVVTAAAQHAAAADGPRGATRMFNVGDLAGAAQAAVRPVSQSRKVPQWAFVTHLISDIILRDRSAMAATAVSANVSVIRRLLLAGASFVLLILVVLMSISFFENRATQTAIQDGAAALPSAPIADMPAIAQLRELESMRTVVQTLEQYRRDGAPWHMRFGLYSSDTLPEARAVYFSRFHALLFAWTQQKLLTELQQVPATPDAEHKYETVYAALKAYLITTTHHQYSDHAFLSPVLMDRWTRGRQVDDESMQLALRQFDFYGDELKEQNPFSSSADPNAVTRARAYLRSMGDEERVYQMVLAAATDRPITFNDGREVVLNRTVIPGAFTKNGFAKVQTAFSHLKDQQSEDWVVEKGASTMPIVDLEKKLRERYTNDFIEKWRAFMANTGFAAYSNYADAARKLEVLTSPPYPDLALLQLVSDNTNVDSADIAKAFQPVRSVVPPGVTIPVQPSNQGYQTALSGLQTAMKTASMAPPNDQSAASQVLTAVAGAYASPRDVAQRFEPDAINRTNRLTVTILEAPIRRAEDVARTGPAAALNGAGAAFCSMFASVSNKFPLDPNAQQEGSLDEMSNIFGAGKALATFKAQLQPFFAIQGTQIVAPPGGNVRLNPDFQRWFNTVLAFAEITYPGGSPQPRLSFGLTQSPKNSKFQELSITVGGDKLSGMGASKQFTWAGNVGARVTLAERGVSFYDLEGPWAPFHFFADAIWLNTGPIPELQIQLQANQRVQRWEDGTVKAAYYELRMNNPWVLEKARLAGMRNCVRVVAR
jgi:type VI secretion system protein ImpL